MEYLVLLYGDESAATEPGTPEFDAEMAGYVAFGELAEKAIRGGAALHLTNTARTIRHDGGTVTVTDGPFAETTEALGGYYVLEADNLDDVIDLVRHIPATAGGASEIRPLVMVQSSLEDAADQRDCWLATMHGPETAADVPGTPEWEAGAAEHGAFAEAAGPALKEGGAVQPAASATTVRVRDGEVVVSDGPFSETIEVVGGFYVLKGSPEEVLELARQIPVGDGGAVELRPIMDLSEM
ncbi:transcription initiation protein [Iamia sp. SCSIO 61187]|uniref:YciI family protein n=1 Tax=Iamia sp. SCSIO 61187 TaxID=2722752 RepID=UPI001C632F58|nr:YciI family protein [Iamia sp. SCSIO 61187]QYG93067.1 transcription initiation protein [Iamia sp. SCSIO 61187]